VGEKKRRPEVQRERETGICNRVNKEGEAGRRGREIGALLLQGGQRGEEKEEENDENGGASWWQVVAQHEPEYRRKGKKKKQNNTWKQRGARGK